MENLNNATITGRIGNIRINEIKNKTVVNMSVATHMFLKNSSKEVQEITTWHNVTLWEGLHVKKADLQSLKVGDLVTIKGRMSLVKYKDENGKVYDSYRLIAKSLELLPSDGQQQSCNEIEIAGYVGSVTNTQVGGTSIVRVSIATNVVFRDKSGTMAIESVWHNVSIFSGDKFPKELTDKIEKGTPLKVTGHIRNEVYTDKEGNNKYTYSIIPTTVEILN